MASTKEQQECFEAFDSNNDGRLNQEEAATAVRALCRNPTEKELSGVMNTLPGELDFNQFTKLVSAAFPKPEQQDGDLRKLMQMLDHDDNGKVSEAELRQLLITVGDPLSHQEMDLLFEEVAVDDLGFLRGDELVERLVHAHTV
eukprot:TRINITY_DN13425_c0_g1_i1.p1 TRINITY_DN13425_c0_g1~~TRINITY_DN13425_c0_g1_i1.p1  ORF type:complete len:144 (-),score=45.81 TRINITY_DN13425_c0_g1_i1:16-447(-)